MEEKNELELKHACNFCGKSFYSGRSLGGHMRSHMINDVLALSDGTTLTRKKLPPVITTTATPSNATSTTENKKKKIKKNSGVETTSYGLRGNPKKMRISETETEAEAEQRNINSSDHGNSVPFDKVCKECGKAFQSWKALFGHMKRHALEKERASNHNNNNDLEDDDDEEEDSLTSATNNKNKKCFVMDSQSDNEIGACNKRKRSKRRLRLAANTSSFVSFAANNNNNYVSSCLSEIDQEQEEVAMCLMMLSRDVGNWGSPLNSESSDNNSVFRGTRGNTCVSKEVKVKTNKTECSVSGETSEFAKHESFEVEPDQTIKDLTSKAGSDPIACSSSKRKTSDSSFDNQEPNSDSTKKPHAVETSLDLDDETGKKSEKTNTKFKCTTCNKVFHSYQALGGHRASHKKLKSSSKVDSSPETTSIETEEDNKLMLLSTNSVKVHECPICLKVFSSGQALGGHKRAHLTGTSESTKDESTIRSFLDLNLPAPIEEQEESIINNVGLNSWWTASGGANHKAEPVLGLISS